MYLDSAIIVKLLVRQSDSEWFDRALAGESFESSELALTEVRSALLAKERKGQITSLERVAAAGKFHSMVEEEMLRLLALNRAVLERASEIQLACHPAIPLRTLDALHVATCECIPQRQDVCDGRTAARRVRTLRHRAPSRALDEIAADHAK